MEDTMLREIVVEEEIPGDPRTPNAIAPRLPD